MEVKRMLHISAAQAKHIPNGQIKIKQFTTKYNNVSVGSIIFLVGTGKEKTYKVVDIKGNATELKIKGVENSKMEKCTVSDFYTVTEIKAGTPEKRKNQLMQKLVDNLFADEEIITDNERQELDKLLKEC
jgi:hypothetical protein